MGDEEDLLILMARRNPLGILQHIQLLQLVSRTHNKAIYKIQSAVRHWMMVKQHQNVACVKIQLAIRTWLTQHQRRKVIICENRNRAAQTVQCFFRRIGLQQRINYRIYVKSINLLFFETPLFNATNTRIRTSTSSSNNTSPDHSSLEGSVTNTIWKSAEHDWNLFCKTDEEAKLSKWETTSPIALTPGAVDIMLEVLGNPSFDTDTKILCLMFCYRTLWTIVESSNTTAETIISDEQLQKLHDLCIPNLSSQNFGLFRASIKVLCEMSYVCPKTMIIPNDITKLLQSRLMQIYCYPVNYSLKFSHSLELKGKDFVLNMRSSVPSDIVRLLHCLARMGKSSWIKLLFENGYFETLIGLNFLTMFDTKESIWYLVANVWDQLPTEDIKFHSKLRSAIRSIMNSNSVMTLLNEASVVFFITRGLHLESFPKGHGYYFDPLDKTQNLSCTCLVKLLIEIICMSHSKKEYFNTVLLHIKESFHINCFTSDFYMCHSGKALRGIFQDHSSLLPILDPSMLKRSLANNSPVNDQLVGLYILRGMSYTELQEFVTIECYVAALKRHPTTIKGAWFHRPKPIERVLEIELCHCAASVGLINCLDCYAGNLMKLADNERNSVMHIAAKHGLHDVLVYLLEKGYVSGASLRNQKGETPIIVAKKYKHFKCVGLLEESLKHDEKHLDELIAIFEDTHEVSTKRKKKSISKKYSPKRMKDELVVKKVKSKPFKTLLHSNGECNESSTMVKKQENPAHDPYPRFQQQEIKIKRDIAKMIFSIHKELPMDKNIIQIKEYTEENANFGIIVIESVDGTLQDILDLPLDKLSVDVRINICKQILNGISTLSQHGTCHGSINPDNIFFKRSCSGNSYIIKLGLIHPSDYHDKKSCPKDLFNPDELNIKGSRRDIFAAGCIFSLILSKNHILGLEYKDQLENAKSHKLQHSKWLQKCAGVEMYDLIARMIRYQECITKCLSHPVFWKPRMRFLFISEIVRQKKELPIDETLSLGEDWREKIPKSGLLHFYINGTNNHYGRSHRDFLRMLRNFYQHPPNNDDDNECYSAALKELRGFPSLFLKLYSIFGSYQDMIGNIEQ